MLWKATPFAGDSRSGLILRYTSPGRLEAEVTYMLADNNALIVDYRATTTKATPVNLTQHSFFNLASKGSGESILDHRPQVNAEVFTLVDSMLIPTGELRAAAGTPFDFTEPKTYRRAHRR